MQEYRVEPESMSASVNDNPEHLHVASSTLSGKSPAAGGSLIVNADDWGRDTVNTDRTLELILANRVSSGSAMVFMQDSERAAELAREHAVDAGLHLNFTLPFTVAGCNEHMQEHQSRLARFLLSHRLAPVLYRPDLTSSFEYIVRTQMEEYERLYGFAPHRLDGHHHMHLCSNVIRQKLLPAGAIVRRNFTFRAGQKSFLNRAYRGWQDRRLARSFCIADDFLDLLPMTAERLSPIFALAMRENVEVETHLYRNDQYEFLRGPVFQNLLCAVKVSRGYVLGSLRSAAEESGLRGFEEVKPRQVAPGFAPKRTEPPEGNPPHIAVCICTYKRPLPLLRLLEELSRQETQGLFTYSVSIVDNDQAGSASSIVAAFAATSKMQIRYMQEPARGIARARNKVVTESEGDYLALIDDDELPARDWLLSALLDCYRFNADGILGPVHSVYDGQPPAWLEKCELFRRAIHPGGEPVKWRDSRTGNVLIKHGVVLGEEAPFRVEIRAGEDQDFFDRKINAGYSFVWSDRAIVSEVIPPARQKRSYIVRKAMLQGACESSLAGAVNMRSLLTSAIAVPIYLLIMPFSLLFGGHRFTTILVKLFYHLGKLLMAAGINPIREEYVSD